jgi:hypothetical protein
VRGAHFGSAVAHAARRHETVVSVTAVLVSAAATLVDRARADGLDDGELLLLVRGVLADRGRHPVVTRG